MSSLSDIMSQQLAEELHENNQKVEQSVDDLTKDEIEKLAGEEMTEDERLAREMQQVFDAEAQEIEEEAGRVVEGEEENEKKEEKDEKAEGEEKKEGEEGVVVKEEGNGGEELTEDERLAREMQQQFDAEFAASLGGQGGKKEKERGHDDDMNEYVEFDHMGTPIYHSNRDEDGEVITKHNKVVCGLRNANKIGLFVDGAGDMDGTVVENSAYNDLKKKSIQAEKRNKRKEGGRP